MKRNRLYALVSWACAAGYLYLVVFGFILSGSGYGICVFKHLTGIPCPSCGATRALLLAMKGEIWASLLMNPLGLIIGILLLVLPIWILYDRNRESQTLLNFYLKTEQLLRKPIVLIPVLALGLTNWIWGISKGL